MKKVCEYTEKWMSIKKLGEGTEIAENKKFAIFISFGFLKNILSNNLTCYRNL